MGNPGPGQLASREQQWPARAIPPGRSDVPIPAIRKRWRRSHNPRLNVSLTYDRARRPDRGQLNLQQMPDRAPQSRMPGLVQHTSNRPGQHPPVTWVSNHRAA